MSRTKPIIIVIPAKTAADKKRVADFEEAMSRQVGFKVTMEVVKDKDGNESRIVGWPMKRGDVAAVEMFMRRGKLATDTAKGKELLKATEKHEATPAAVMASKGLAKTAQAKAKELL
jgi:hypothetical protein